MARKLGSLSDIHKALGDNPVHPIQLSQYSVNLKDEKGQVGLVTISFTVSPDGNIIAAHEFRCGKDRPKIVADED